MSNLLQGANLSNQILPQEKCVNRDKFSTKGYFWGISYDPGLKTEFHISCTNLPKTILDLQNVCILADFLPQPSNFCPRIYLPYP